MYSRTRTDESTCIREFLRSLKKKKKVSPNCFNIQIQSQQKNNELIVASSKTQQKQTIPLLEEHRQTFHFGSKSNAGRLRIEIL